MPRFILSPLLRLRRLPGFALVELLVALGILAMMLLFVMPGVRTYLIDSRIRAAAQAYLGGAMLARTEALRRNERVQIVLTDDPAATPLVPSSQGRGWLVRLADGSQVLQVKAASEGAGRSLQVHASEPDLQFDGRGAAHQEYAISFKLQDAGACLPGGRPRCLTVQVSRGGQVRLCDPSITASGDNRKC